MSWGYVAAAAIVAVGSYTSAKKSGEAAKDAARIAAGAQGEAGDYLERQDVIPRQFREGALRRLGGLYGLEGGEGSQQEFIDQAMESPLYQNLLKGGQESVLRSASATGGLRSGNVQDALARSQNDALLTTYNQQLGGLSSLANLPSNANEIASLMAQQGGTLAAGNVAAAQARQQGMQNTYTAIGQGAQAYGDYKYSDIRAKENILPAGRENGFNIYTWDWKPEYKHIGVAGKDRGVMAHEVYDVNPDAVCVINDLLLVDYRAIGLN